MILKGTHFLLLLKIANYNRNLLRRNRLDVLPSHPVLLTDKRQYDKDQLDANEVLNNVLGLILVNSKLQTITLVAANIMFLPLKDSDKHRLKDVTQAKIKLKIILPFDKIFPKRFCTISGF